MNLAARMEPQCEPVQIVLLKDLYPMIQHDLRFINLGEHQIYSFRRKHIDRLENTDEIANDLHRLP